MTLRDTPIKRRTVRAFLLTCGAVLLLTSVTYFIYTLVTYRQMTSRQLSILGKVIAANSTAALAFESKEDAFEILAALKAQPSIEEASIYGNNGKVFSSYPANIEHATFPSQAMDGYRFTEGYLIGYEPIIQEDKRLGTLFLKSNMDAIYEQLQLYGLVILVAIVISLTFAYLLSKKMQGGITKPILALAETAKIVSDHQDYSVRAIKLGNDEIGQLTDSFNHMLTEIEAKNAEIQLFNQKLEERIEKRTAQLAAINKELEAFSYSVSHDLRAPLRSIDGYSRILIEDFSDKLGDEGIGVLNRVIRNALKMGHLIDDLLTFSRVGKQSLTKMNLNMEALTSQVVKELTAQESTGASITTKEMLPVEGDVSMLRQVMTNLVSNALKYSGKSKNPTIEIGSYRKNSNNIYYVKDNGAGFDMSYYDKLFGVFQRLHSDNDFAGTGVGLALVKRIINKHNGKIWAEGKVDKGAIFSFSLPVKSPSDRVK